MRNSSKSPFVNNSLVTLKDNRWLERQRIAGKIVAASLNQLEGYCKSMTSHSMATLNDIIERFIIKEGGYPTFKGYKKSGGPDFPAGVCISVNKSLVHGIPDDTVLNHGDVVSFDLGVTYEGQLQIHGKLCRGRWRHQSLRSCSRLLGTQEGRPGT